VQFRPQTIDVRATKALYPLATLSDTLSGALRAGGLRVLADGSQLNFFF
jgi:hypothetical protein